MLFMGLKTLNQEIVTNTKFIFLNEEKMLILRGINFLVFYKLN